MKIQYVGPEALTRGEYGERVEAGHVGRFDSKGEFIEDPNGDTVAVWDASFGWQVWGAWPGHPDFKE
jgi:hypothetical protein